MYGYVKTTTGRHNVLGLRLPSSPKLNTPVEAVAMEVFWQCAGDVVDHIDAAVETSGELH